MFFLNNRNAPCIRHFLYKAKAHPTTNHSKKTSIFFSMSALRIVAHSFKLSVARGGICAHRAPLRACKRSDFQHTISRALSDHFKPSSAPPDLEHSFHSQPQAGLANEHNDDRGFGDSGRVTKGRIVYPDGAVYTGDVLNGEKHGYGIYETPNGGSYEGDFQFNLQHGRGKLIFPNGGSYTGDFYKNVKHGRGVQVSPSGLVYDGEWVNHTRCGKGKLTFVNGDVYEGDFVDGLMHGCGVSTFKTGKYEGEFAFDQKHGKGKLTFSSDGEYYVGDFQHNKAHGFGKKVSKYGEYVGEMRDGKPNGLGRLVSPKGRIQEGLFQDGRFVKSVE